MTDVHDKATRSYNMSRIRSKNTKPELIVRKFLFAKGFRYRVNVKSLPGTPDIVLPKYKTAIFVHGCFWHGHEGCKYFVIPKTRTRWWLEKIQRNIKLDLENKNKLIIFDWKVLYIWECQLKTNEKDRLLNELITKIY